MKKPNHEKKKTRPYMLMGFKKGMARALCVRGLTSGDRKAKLKSTIVTDGVMCQRPGHFFDSINVTDLCTRKENCVICPREDLGVDICISKKVLPTPCIFLVAHKTRYHISFLCFLRGTIEAQAHLGDQDSFQTSKSAVHPLQRSKKPRGANGKAQL